MNIEDFSAWDQPPAPNTPASDPRASASCLEHMADPYEQAAERVGLTRGR